MKNMFALQMANQYQLTRFIFDYKLNIFFLTITIVNIFIKVKDIKFEFHKTHKKLYY